MSQLTLEDALEGERLKAEGTKRADLAEPQEWKDRCDRAIRHLASTGQEFSAEDVRELVGDPLHFNAMGSRFLAASRVGLIEPVGRRKSSRPTLHAHEIRTWRGTESASAQGPGGGAFMGTALPVRGHSHGDRPAPSITRGA